MSELRCEIYTLERKEDWDQFIDESKNAPFFFKRNFMEYHKDRFVDFSVLLIKDERIVALVPANINAELKTVVSHGGLTFGGFVLNQEIGLSTFMDCFDTYLDFLRSKGILKLKYKAIPPFYHQIPSFEEYFAIIERGGKLVRRDINSVLYPANRLDFQSIRKRMIKKAHKNDVQVCETKDFESFWKVLNEVLSEKHGAKPVHTLQEIKYLSSLFPSNIRLFCGYKNEKVLSGVVIFESHDVAHCQYIASSQEGRECGALDIVFDSLINTYFENKRVFSFGTSMEVDGQSFNAGLVSQKEGFGGRTTIHDIYELNL